MGLFERIRLFRFGKPGAERPGVLVFDGQTERGFDVSGFVADYDEKFFSSGGITRLKSMLEKNQDWGSELDLRKCRFGPAVARPSKLVGVGLNYRAHAEETGGRVPHDPKLFMKATTAIAGCNDALVLPRGASQTDYEVELALVIGRRTSSVSEEEAQAHIAGYMVCNDYSERDWQKNRSGQFVKGKSADGFAPLGPVLVPADQLDPRDLGLWLSVNGEIRQNSRTSDMIFDCATIVSRTSVYMTLLPGDVITTGTPSGVALGMPSPRFLQPGDVVHYGIEGIGEARQQVVASTNG